jgi:hypothetical protein
MTDKNPNSLAVKHISHFSPNTSTSTKSEENVHHNVENIVNNANEKKRGGCRVYTPRRRKCCPHYKRVPDTPFIGIVVVVVVVFIAWMFSLSLSVILFHFLHS